MRRVALVASVGAAMMGPILASPTSAAVSDGSGFAAETVFCNSITHRITVSTISTGIVSNQLVSSPQGIAYNYFLKYPVWLRMQEYVNGAWATFPWVQVADGTHQYPFSERAGATSYWYFTWAFQTASGAFDYKSEWAGGSGANGIYSDQRGFIALPSCRS